MRHPHGVPRLLLLLLCLLALPAGAHGATWVIAPNVTLHPETAPPPAPRTALELFAGQGEVEGEIVAIRPDAAMTITPRMSDLAGPGVIPAGAASIARIGYVPISRPSTGVDRLESSRYPDPLYDLAPAQAVELPGGETTGLLVEVAVPAQAAAGTYRATLDLGSAGSIPLSLEVLPVAVDRDRRPFVGRLDVTSIARHYGVRESDERLVEGLYSQALPLLRAHGVSPSQIPASVPRIDDSWQADFAANGSGSRLARGAALGFPAFEMPYLPLYSSIEDRTYADARRPTWAASLGSGYAPYSGRLFSLPVDEPDEREYAVVTRAAAQLKAANAPARVMVTEAPTERALAEMGSAVDIWAPTLWSYYLHRTRMDELRRQGKGTWWYVYGSDTQRYTPNLLIDKPLTEPRLLGWLGEELDVQGVFYWALTAWRESGSGRDPLQQPWGLSHVTTADRCGGGGRQVGGNGEGSLLYPSGDIDRPLLRSLRLVAVRDGLEDQSLINALQERDPAAAATLAGATARAYSGQNAGFTPCSDQNRPPYLPVLVNDPGQFTALRLWLADRLAGRPGSSVTGTVTHRGRPVRAATVRAAGIATTTDARGRFRLAGLPVADAELIVSRDREGRIDAIRRPLTRDALRRGSFPVGRLALPPRTERPIFDTSSQLRAWRARARPARVHVRGDVVRMTVNRTYQANGRELNNGNIIAPEAIIDLVGPLRPKANWRGWRNLRMTIDLRNGGPADQPWRLVVTPGGDYRNARYLLLAPGAQQVQLPLAGLRNLAGTRYLRIGLESALPVSRRGGHNPRATLWVRDFTLVK